jgi:hypothetical protein
VLLPLLLIHPPAAKACEPPAGIARLNGVLRGAGVPCRVLDANLDGQLHLLGQPPAATDTWTRRAHNSRERHLNALRRAETYRTPARYARAVSDLNRLLAMAGAAHGATVGLADYRQDGLSSLASTDLLKAAEHPERNPFFPWFNERLPELLAGVGIVGFSLNYLSQALSTFAMVGFIRRHAPQVTIVLGGGLVTSWLRRPGWSDPFAGLVDHLVAGPGEAFLVELCGSVPGQPHALPDYAALPLTSYLAPGPILPYSAATGCYWNHCSFCPERAEGTSYHPLPIAQALDELHALCARHRPVLVHLLDNAVSPALLRALCERPLPAPWYGFARIDAQLADPDFCLALRRSGCVMLKLGLESGDQGVLDSLHKGTELAMAERVLANLKKAGIAVYGYLLFGTPAEDAAAARRTLEFVARHADAIDFLNVALFNMPAFGDEAAAYATQPFYEADLSLYTGFRHPHGWERAQVRRFISSEFSRHPAVAAILRRDPAQFTSNHAPLFAMAESRQRRECA